MFDRDKKGITGIFLHYLSGLSRDKYLFFHGSCVAKGGRAVVFMGPSFSGKTTLALMCASLGFDILSDDVVMMRKDDLSVMSFPIPLLVREESRDFIRKLDRRYVADDGARVGFTPAVDSAVLSDVFLIGDDKGLTPPLFMLKNSFLNRREMAGEYLRDIIRLTQKTDISFAGRLTLARERHKSGVYELLKKTLERF